jgi:hypothetical protein
MISIISLSLLSSQSYAVDILWNPGVSNDLAGGSANLVPGAKIRNTGLLVNKDNPDILIMKIIMNDSFEDKPFSSKGRNMAMWIYWPKDYCWGENQKNCDGLFTVSVPSNPRTYPTTLSTEYIIVDSHNKESNVDKKETNCKAFWWIESSFKPRDTWAFAVSITCLGIPKTFGWYAYSSIDLGQTDVATDFTQVQTISYPFHDLAKGAVLRSSNFFVSNSQSQKCVVGVTGAGYKSKEEFEEQCSDSESWEFIYCSEHPRADLEILNKKKWRKVESKKGIAGNCDSKEAKFEFTFSWSNKGKYRIKNYGNSEFMTSFINLRATGK